MASPSGPAAPRELQTVALFPEDRVAVAVDEASIVRLRLSELSVHRPRECGACWLALHLWKELRLDQFWMQRLPPSRKADLKLLLERLKLELPPQPPPRITIAAGQPEASV